MVMKFVLMDIFLAFLIRLYTGSSLESFLLFTNTHTSVFLLTEVILRAVSASVPFLNGRHMYAGFFFTTILLGIFFSVFIILLPYRLRKPFSTNTHFTVRM